MHISTVGSCRVFGLDDSEQDVLESMDRHGVDVSIVQPYQGADSAREVHDRIAAMAKDHPGRFFGIPSINPHQDPNAYFAELKRCVKNLAFVGVKLHTIGHAVNPAGVDGATVFESASQLEIAVMVHTGPGFPFAAPSSLASQLRRFPQVQ